MFRRAIGAILERQCFVSSAGDPMPDRVTHHVALWQGRLQRARAPIQQALPFVLTALATIGLLWLHDALTPSPAQLTSTEVAALVQETLTASTPEPPYSTLVYRTIRPSIVFINVQNDATPAEQDVETPRDRAETAPAEQEKTGEPETREPEVGSRPEESRPSGGLGSGVIINANGDILTSLHVVADARTIRVIFADGTETSAQIANAVPEQDIALLTPDRLPELVVPATLGNPNALQIGDDAYVVGHPLGLYGSMSTGVISGFDRSFRPPDGGERLEGLIQFDAAVNPGNSGGPLLNRAGQVVGIVAGLANPTESSFFIGIGFAVPIDTAGGAAELPPY